MTTSAPSSFVRAMAAVSGVYDGLVGLFLLLAADRFASLFGVAPAQPPIFSDLNALFLLAVGAGYYWPYRDPVGARWYMWVMGPGLKGAGAIAFLATTRPPLPRVVPALCGERRRPGAADAGGAAVAPSTQRLSSDYVIPKRNSEVQIWLLEPES